MKNLGQIVTFAALICVFGLLFLLVLKSMNLKEAEDIDVTKMRHIYVALTMYEAANDGDEPPSLMQVRTALGSDSEFQAEKDPMRELKAASYPIDPFLTAKLTAPSRISFSYIGNFLKTGNQKRAAWQSIRGDRRISMLVSPWYGQIEQKNDFGFSVEGSALGLSTDGSLETIKLKTDSDQPDLEQLFGLPQSGLVH